MTDKKDLGADGAWKEILGVGIILIMAFLGGYISGYYAHDFEELAETRELIEQGDKFYVIQKVNVIKVEDEKLYPYYRRRK